MPFPRREINDSPLLRQSAGELSATLGQSLSATISDPLLRPTELLAEFAQQQALAGGEDPLADRDDLTVEEKVALRGSGAPEARPVPVNLMTPEEAKAEFSDVGLEIDAPAPRAVVERKAKVRRDQLIRDDIIARGPQGVAATGARFGVSLLGAAVDPLNIAAAFVPVVREARFAGLAARFGVTRARALTGAIEGAVGSAAIEPAVFGLADEVALDYSMTDALINVSLGTILGGGLHVGGGAAADVVREVFPKRGRPRQQKPADIPEQPDVTAAANPEALELALRASVARVVSGEDVNAKEFIQLAGIPAVRGPHERPNLAPVMAARRAINESKTVDTRGSGQRFHGSRQGDIADLRSADDAFNEVNFYGQGFYTTDALDVANGYAGSRGSVYTVRAREGARLFDMEQTIPSWMSREFDNLGEPLDLGDGRVFEPENAVFESFRELQEEGADLTLRNIYERSWELAQQTGESALDLQESFFPFEVELRNRGFRGFRHMGGQLTGTKGHEVKIYWFPEDDIAIEKLTDRNQSIESLAEAKEPAERTEAIDRAEAAAREAVDDFDLDLARRMADEIELPDDLPGPEAARLAEADAFVAEAENTIPSLQEAGRCLAA